MNPPDLTEQSILVTGVTNTIDVTFADTKVAYTLSVYLVEKANLQTLLGKIKKRGLLSNEATLNKSMCIGAQH